MVTNINCQCKPRNAKTAKFIAIFNRNHQISLFCPNSQILFWIIMHVCSAMNKALGHKAYCPVVSRK